MRCCTPSLRPCCTRNGPARVSSVSTTISAKPTSSGRAVRAEERAQPEALARCGFGGDVDLGVVVGGRQRVDRCEQLGGGREREPPPALRADAPLPAEPAARDRGSGGRDECPDRLGRVAAIPERGRDPSTPRRGADRSAVTAVAAATSSSTASASTSSPGPVQQRAVARATSPCSSSCVPLLDRVAVGPSARCGRRGAGSSGGGR